MKTIRKYIYLILCLFIVCTYPIKGQDVKITDYEIEVVNFDKYGFIDTVEVVFKVDKPQNIFMVQYAIGQLDSINCIIADENFSIWYCDATREYGIWGYKFSIIKKNIPESSITKRYIIRTHFSIIKSKCKIINYATLYIINSRNSYLPPIYYKDSKNMGKRFCKD